MKRKLHVTRTPGPIVHLLTDVLTAAVTIVTCQFTVSVVLGELKSRSALTGDASFGCFSANVGTAVIFIHAGGHIFSSIKTQFGSLDAGVLVVRQEKSVTAPTLVTPHHVNTDLLASAVSFRALVNIQAVVSVVGQAEAVVARASVVSRDVHALVNASSIIFTGTLIDIFTVLSVAFVS